jgi:hypothetical protein
MSSVIGPQRASEEGERFILLMNSEYRHIFENSFKASGADL